jgi:hypothetical protein
MLPLRARVNAGASDLVTPADHMLQATNGAHRLHVDVGKVQSCSKITVDAKVCNWECFLETDKCNRRPVLAACIGTFLFTQES